MTLNELRYFIAVAREKNFGRAAAKCYVSQPALSIAIQKLEEELGVLLLERGKSEIYLTAIGEQLLPRALHIIESAESFKGMARAAHDPLQGILKLGVIFTVAPYLLPDLIPALHEMAPAMPLDIEENLTENLAVALASGEIDAAIVALPFSLSGVNTEFLYEESFCVVVPKSHHWSDRASINASELAGDQPILLNVGHCFRDQVLDTCPELNTDAHIAHTNSLETVRNMVASGLGISVLPSDAIAPKYKNDLVLAIPFEEPVPKRHIAVAYRKTFPRASAIATLVEAIKIARPTPLTSSSSR